MSDHPETNVDHDSEESHRDGVVDAISAVVLILLAVITCIYFVANM